MNNLILLLILLLIVFYFYQKYEHSDEYFIQSTPPRAIGTAQFNNSYGTQNSFSVGSGNYSDNPITPTVSITQTVPITTTIPPSVSDPMTLPFTITNNQEPVSVATAPSPAATGSIDVPIATPTSLTTIPDTINIPIATPSSLNTITSDLVQLNPRPAGLTTSGDVPNSVSFSTQSANATSNAFQPFGQPYLS
jgi:hypothetical protein